LLRRLLNSRAIRVISGDLQRVRRSGNTAKGVPPNRYASAYLFLRAPSTASFSLQMGGFLEAIAGSRPGTRRAKTGLDKVARTTPFRQTHLGGFDATTAVPPGRAAGPEAVSSVAPRQKCLGAPCVIASERPSHPGDERGSAKPS